MSARVEPRVLWREGMFLCPQHMQAFAREIHSRISQTITFGLPGAYGLLDLEVDGQALERDVFAVTKASVVFSDGTPADFPEIAKVEPRQFASFFTESVLEVYLGVPAPKPNVPQVDFGTEQRARYRVQVGQAFDEYMRDAVRDLEFGDLQARLFFGEEDRTGFECLPIARIARHGKPVARSILSPDYIPPVLRCGASTVLMRALKEMADSVRGQARDLSAKIPATASLSSVEKGADIAGFVKLQAVNRCIAILDQVSGMPDLHPFDAYMGLVESVGNLAVFGPERVIPSLPVYHHAGLDACFATVLKVLGQLIVAEVSVPYDSVSFRKDATREGFFACDIPKEWLGRQRIFYFAVEVAEDAEEVIQLVSTGLKLVPPSDIERVLNGVIPGIQFTYERVPPLSFPKRANLHYFRIQSEGASREAWLKVLDARSAVLLSTLGALGDVFYHLYVELRG